MFLLSIFTASPPPNHSLDYCHFSHGLGLSFSLQIKQFRSLQKAWYGDTAKPAPPPPIPLGPLLAPPRADNSVSQVFNPRMSSPGSPGVPVTVLIPEPSNSPTKSYCPVGA